MIKESWKSVWEYLLSNGLTKAGAAGLMGNLYAESGIIFNRLENLCRIRLRENGKGEWSDEAYTKAVDDGTISKAEFLHPLPGKQYGYGVVQWTSPSRKEGLYDEAKSRGVSIADEELQLYYLIAELRTYFKSVYEVLVTSDDVKACSDIVLVKFEAPANATSQSSKRYSYAKEIYDAFGKEKAMAVIIGSARGDEYRNASGGRAGDQIQGSLPDYAGEVSREKWYLHSKGWYVMRAKDPVARERIAKDMEYACDNSKIGYDQSQNQTLWNTVKPLGFDCSKVTTACETDCARLVRVCVWYAGIECADFYTASLVDTLKKTGQFEYFTSDKYCKSSDYLMRGDILVTRTKGHTVVVLSNGAKVEPSKPSEPSVESTTPSSLNRLVKEEGIVSGCSALNVRTWAGADNPKCSFSPLNKGTVVGLCDVVKAANGDPWYYIKYNNKYGFVNAKYISVENEPQYYTVKAGDTLSSIAAKYGTTYQKIAELSGITNPNVISVGQVVRVK